MNRAGAASVLAAMAVGGSSYAEACRQLSIRYLHFDNNPDHIVGMFLRYEAYCRDKGLGTNGWEQFKHWALTEYYPHYYRIQIVVPQVLRLAPGQRVDLEPKVINRSHYTIPFALPDGKYEVVAFFGDMKTDEFPVRFRVILLPKRDLQPGQATAVRMSFPAPVQTGNHDLHFDVQEQGYGHGYGYFSWNGSPVSTCRLIVTPKP